MQGQPEGSVIHCAQCGKENQDHYKFCLGCGVELPSPEPVQEASPSAPPKDVMAREPSGNWGGTGSSDGAAAHLDDGALFASAAAATLDSPGSGRQRIVTPVP